MINSLSVENFRCFRKLSVEDLGRLNVVVGGNGAGKTALLESIVLPSGRQDVVFQLRAHRGMAQPPPLPLKPVYEALWKDLFFQFSQDATITISLRGTAENTRTLRVSYKPESDAPLLIGFQTKDVASAAQRVEPVAIVPITFETDVGGQRYTSTVGLDTSNPNTPKSSPKNTTRGDSFRVWASRHSAPPRPVKIDALLAQICPKWLI